MTWKNHKVWLVVGTAVCLWFLVACSGGQEAPAPTVVSTHSAEHPTGQTGIEIPHLHGLGFSADGRQLMVPAHDGLRIYSDGQWLIPDVPAHDYMGYAAVDEGFYSSGHPHPASGLVNPFGLVKSTDMGETLVKLGFEGESDFHLMAVGYENHAIYVANPAPNSKLSPGVHYSLDDGQTWQQSALQGINAQMVQMAVHPTQAATMALATEGGLFLSEDYGDSFVLVVGRGPATAVTFRPDGQQLLAGYTLLFAYDLSTRQIQELTVPTLTADDAISYIAMNPTDPEEIALATFEKDIFLSPDGGQSWTQIVHKGKTP